MGAFAERVELKLAECLTPPFLSPTDKVSRCFLKQLGADAFGDKRLSTAWHVMAPDVSMLFAMRTPRPGVSTPAVLYPRPLVTAASG